MRQTRCALLFAALATTQVACTTDNVGIPPSLESHRLFHYPIAGAISPDGDFLYVVNSDFNLEFSGALVNVVHLAGVRAAIAAGRSSTDPALGEGEFIGRDGATVPVPSERSSVRIHPFATAARLRDLDPDPGRTRLRLYVTVRGDGTLTWIDIGDGGASLDCGQRGRGQACDVHHRRGQDTTDGQRGLVLPPLPVSLDAGDDGLITVVHQEAPRARVSLFVDPDGVTGTEGPSLVHFVGDLSPSLTALLRLDDPLQTPGATPHWYAVSRFEPVIHHVRAFRDGGRSFLYRSHATTLQGIASDVGVRAVVRDPCNPGRAYATARPRPPDQPSVTPQSGDQLLALDLSNPEEPVVANVLSLPPGPSNLVAIVPTGNCATSHTVVYVISFDARKVYVIDGLWWRELAQIRTQAGPHVLVADPRMGMPGHHYLYLIDFTAMVVEVIDVNTNEVVFTIGDVVRPQDTT